MLFTTPLVLDCIVWCQMPGLVAAGLPKMNHRMKRAAFLHNAEVRINAEYDVLS